MRVLTLSPLSALHRLVLTTALVAGFAATAAPEQARPGLALQPAGARHPVKTQLHTVALTDSRDAVADGARPAAVPEQTKAKFQPRSGLSPAVTTAQLDTQPFSLVGVTWTGAVGDGDLSAYVRTRSGGVWSSWYALPPSDADHGPDAGSAEAAHERRGTDPLVVGAADGVQVRVDTPSGAAPAGLRLDLVDPGTSPADGSAAMAPASATTATTAATAVSAATTAATTATTPTTATTTGTSSIAAQPTIYSRAQWGADESLVRSAPEYGTIRGAFVHHTVSANNYSAADVPGIIRGIYAYHVQSQGWNDIGYNFLVDRFGRIWEGRRGGIDRAVIGAHTAGYNSVGFAMAAIGTYTDVAAPAAVISAYQRLFAWKFSLHGVDPRQRTYYYDSTKSYNAISGHRDVYPTECPGNALYAQLGTIRSGTIAAMPPFPRFGQLFAVGDVNGDGDKDLGAIGSDGVLWIYPGNRRTGGFLAPYVAGRGWGIIDRVLGVGDFDGDGKDDILGRERATGRLYLYPGPGSPGTGYTTRRQVGSGWLQFDSITAAGDVNGDGHPDLVAHDGDGKLWLYPSDGTAGWLSRSVVGYGWWSVNILTGGTDLTGDGRDDLVGRTPTGDVYIYPGPGRPGAGYTSRVKAATGWQDYDAIVAPGNWTPDAYPDLIARKAGARTLHLFYGNGKAQLSGGRQIGNGW